MCLTGSSARDPINIGLIVDNRLTHAKDVFQSTAEELASNHLKANSITFSILYDDKGSCTDGENDQESEAALMEFHFNQEISAVFGPTCYDDLGIAARLTEEWDILQFNFWSDHPSDYYENSIIQMTTQSTVNFAENILAFLVGAEWNKITIISCTDCYDSVEVEGIRSRVGNISEFLLANDIEIIISAEVTKNFTISQYEEVLKEMNSQSRVVVPFCGDYLADYSKLQLAMRNLNYSTDDFSTLFTIGSYSLDGLQTPWEKDDELGDAFNKCVVLYNKVFDSGKAKSFMNNMGFPQDDIQIYIQLAESVYVFDHLLQMPDTENISATELLPKLENIEGPYGTISFNENHHRIAPFSVLFIENGTMRSLPEKIFMVVNTENGKAECPNYGPCLRFNPPKMLLNAGQPTCGFNGELCDQTGTVIVIAAVMSAVFVSVGVFVGIRRMKSGEVATMPWSVTAASLKIIELDATIRGSQAMSILSLQQHMEDTAKIREFMRGRQLATLDQAYVVVEKYQLKERLVFDKSDQNTLFQLKTLSHDNINPFMGILFDRSSDLMVLWTHCFRGSLAEMIFATKEESGVAFDKNFRGAFVRDLLKALDYLHSSQIGYHGSLTPAQCFIDSHWILKLSGAGMSRMLYKWKNNNVIGTMDGKPLIPNNELHYYSPETRRWLKSLMYTNREDNLAITPQQGQAADMYAFGVVLYELVFRRRYVDIEDVYHAESVIEDDNLILCEQAEAHIPLYPITPTDISEEHPDLIGLMHKCWTGQIDQRPDATLARKITDATLKMSGSLVDQMIKNMELYTSGLEDLVKERTGQLEEAQKMADELLSELLPKSIAEDLKMGRRVEAKNYKSVTVMYSDIVGFTSLCSESQPMEVVALLSGMFDNFDKIISAHDGYKMETIGDAYCVASGIPQPNKLEHVRNIATIALLQREYLKTFEIPHRPGLYLHCRWGFNTGPVFTGVVGIRAPRYSVFGQSVTIASKMENLGIPDKIQMTLKSHQILASRFPEFKCSPRGSTKVPGVGTLLTYWLDGVVELLKSHREESFDNVLQHKEEEKLADPYNFPLRDVSVISSATSVEPLITADDL